MDDQISTPYGLIDPMLAAVVRQTAELAARAAVFSLHEAHLKLIDVPGSGIDPASLDNSPSYRWSQLMVELFGVRQNQLLYRELSPDGVVECVQVATLSPAGSERVVRAVLAAVSLFLVAEANRTRGRIERLGAADFSEEVFDGLEAIEGVPAEVAAHSLRLQQTVASGQWGQMCVRAVAHRNDSYVRARHMPPAVGAAAGIPFKHLDALVASHVAVTGCGAVGALRTASAAQHRKPGRRDIDLVIRSEPVRLKSAGPAFEHLSMYMVLVYGHLGTYAMIATPACRALDGRHRISTIFATANGFYRCKEPELFQTVARSVVSDCFHKDPPLSDVLDVLTESFRPTEPDSPSSAKRKTKDIGGAVLTHFHSLIRQRLRTSENEYRTWFRDRHAVKAISMPKTDGHPKCDINRPEEVEALVIAANERGVGFSADLLDKPFGSLNEAVQKVSPKMKLKGGFPQDFQKEFERTLTLTKPGGKFAKSWDSAINNNGVQDIVRVFSNVMKNISWMPPEVENEIEGVIGVHLQGLDSELDAGHSIATTWKSGPKREGQEPETSAAGDWSVSAS
ncbi:hypothetical protein ACQP0C_41835 (plasmid) [Nocardia sp. CA-129566]|uniref:hypothetical protein n=1 Tax=Nocardia sp. CA-129566 TaxID=3239976 RepID=UPI003D991A12